MSTILTGLDRLRDGYWKKLKGYRLGLLANQASVDSRLNRAKDIIKQLLPGQLKALFGPQHGFGGEDQDNMVETDHFFDSILQIPVFSLYGETREPLPHMLEIVDILVIDLQDVGTRVYTFASTMLNCLSAAAKNGKKVLILDRPNPLGGETVEGNLLRPELYSFVGPYSLPMRHGLTMGEMALIFNHVYDLGCDLEIIPMLGWLRKMVWEETGLRWVMPSPNMPFPETAYVYPGQVIWEGTNLSEGRGTCRPFEIFGSPYLDTSAIKRALEPEATLGCHLQEFSFRPTFQKWGGQICHGFILHALDPHIYRPYFTSISILRAVMETHRRDFEWKEPPYEYEYKKKPIDLIMGDSSLLLNLESGDRLSLIEQEWLADLESFVKWRGAFLLYS
ncbi:MAG: DUF1343 domain-containing protein [Thermodesulfobacteriota bacterium]|nr:DUF1343 domain-containing protein [Thermodesulfobacteriota bacterium]